MIGDMYAEDIRDQKSLTLWLSGRSRDDCIVIASRAALRVAPLLFVAMESDWAHQKKLTPLPVLRCLLTSYVGRANSSPELKAAANSASLDAAEFAYRAHRNEIRLGVSTNLLRSVIRSASAAAAVVHSAVAESTIDGRRNPSFPDVRGSYPAAQAETAATSVASSARAALQSEYASIFALSPSDSSQFAANSDLATRAWKQSSADGQILDQGLKLDGITLGLEFGGLLRLEWNAVREKWQEPGSPYSFWLRWYQSVLDGTPMNPEMLCAIAMIPEADWQQGPAHVAGVIARLEGSFELLKQIGDLKNRLREAERQVTSGVATLEHRSHNNPPDLIDASASIRRETVIIWAALEEAEAELPKSNPDLAALKRIGLTLLGTAKHLAVYCADLADIALKKAAEELGSTGAKAAILSWTAIHAAQAEPIQTMGKALLDFVQKLSGTG